MDGVNVSREERRDAGHTLSSSEEEDSEEENLNTGTDDTDASKGEFEVLSLYCCDSHFLLI